MTANLARRMTAEISYNGRDITRDIAPLLVACTYTDNAGERADELSLTLADLNLLWGGRWRPRAGDTLTCTLIVEHRVTPGTRESLPCGTFHIAADSFRLGARQLTLQATSVPLDSGIRRERRHRQWEQCTLREIAADIAARAGLTLLYEAPVNPRSERKDQQYQSDIAFLQAFAGQFGVRVKLRPPRLILFDEPTYERRPAVLTITPDTPLLDGEIRHNYDDVYCACTVSYHDPGKGQDGPSATFTAPHPPPVADVLRVNERVESQAAALAVARVRLREKNRNACPLSLELPFNPLVLGATVVQIRGFSDIDDGRYFVDRVTHSTADTTSAELHQCLEGY